jgi:hypothetical protein
MGYKMDINGKPIQYLPYGAKKSGTGTFRNSEAAVKKLAGNAQKDSSTSTLTGEGK